MKLTIQNVVDWLERNHFNYSSDLHSEKALFCSISLCTENICLQDVLYVCDFSRLDAEATLVYIVSWHGDVITVADTDPQQLLNSLVSMFDYFNRWETRLLQSVLERAPLEAIGDIVDEFFQGPAFAWFPDDYPRPLTSKYSPDCCPLWKAIVESPEPPHETIRRFNGSVSIYPEKTEAGLYTLPHGQGSVLYVPVVQNGRVVTAVMAIQYNNSFLPGDVNYLECFVRVLNRHMLLRRDVYWESSYLEQYLRSAISDTNMMLTKQSVLQKKASWCLHKPCYMLAASPLATYSMDLGSVLYRLRKHGLPGTCFFMNRDRKLIALVDSTQHPEPEVFYEIITRGVQMPIYMGISNVDTGAESIKKRYGSALLALSHCRDEQPLTYSRDIIVQELRNRLVSNADLLPYVHPALRIVYAYDKRDNTQLLKTLYCFVFHECNYSEASRVLHVSRNTLIQQINRIVELTGIDFSDYTQFSALLFSFLIYRDSEIF